MSEAMPLAFFSMPGGTEWLVIALVALLIFGKRLPGVARSLGEALHEFRSGFSGQDSEAKPADQTKPVEQAKPAEPAKTPEPPRPAAEDQSAKKPEA